VSEILEIFRIIFEKIESIRTPLQYWAFWIAIAAVLIFLVLKYPKWLEIILGATVRKLSKKQFFQLSKQALKYLFILCLITIILSFFAPLTLRFIDYLERPTGKIARSIAAHEGEILGSKELDRQLAQAMQRYENEKYIKAAVILNILQSGGLCKGGSRSLKSRSKKSIMELRQLEKSFDLH
jgi:hypothetical protein